MPRVSTAEAWPSARCTVTTSHPGGWGWDRRDSSVSIHQVVAGTLALLGATYAGDNSTGEAFFL
ncbi:hypothetical protein [Mycobacterium sp. DL440]|uniref:hypothetical protein n=1 Tax=Mycobacterium sp. DL440 TaxID=2675523 RepID=UPI00141E0066|nr:hypothetical protein [Mycobacterium sp. DL440]